MNEGMHKERKIEENGVVIEGAGFYNPAQKFNRTLTIKIINHFIEVNQRAGIVLLECMSATGLRGIRYIRELQGDNTIVLNDISKTACNSIVENCRRNGIQAELQETVLNNRTKVEIRDEDCRSIMLNRKKSFDVIDIDPFGTCAPYIESAIEGLAENGLLCVTSTDTKVLCDKPPEACYKYYGSLSMNNPHSHETAIRIVLSYISRIAAKFGKTIEPLVSLSLDFFIRVFVRVSHNKARSTDNLLQNRNYAICCCMNREQLPILQKEVDRNVYKHVKMPVSTVCRLCKRTVGLYGPFWNGPLHCKTFLEGVIKGIPPEDISSKTGGVKETAFTQSQINRRIHGMLSMARDEIAESFYFPIPAIASRLSLPVPPLELIISFLLKNNVKVSLTHCKPNSIKTNGPIEYVYLSVALYYKNIRPEIYIPYNERLQGKRKDIDKNTYNLIMYLDEYTKNNKILEDFTVDKAATEMTSRKYLKFQDKAGLAWGPMKR